MSFNINQVSDAYSMQTSYSKTKENKETEAKVSSASTGFSDVAAVYEPSNEDTVTKKETTDKGQALDRSAIVAQLKADNEARIASMKDMVMKMMQGQGNAIASADSIWSFLASGNYTVSEAAKAEAQKAISEDGYWGVEQTSDRILDFAKALSGNDVSKADELLEAFKKGYKQATKAWGKELPSISKDTYDAVEKKFNAWKNEASNTASVASSTETAASI